jgi:hypothetical protein
MKEDSTMTANRTIEWFARSRLPGPFSDIGTARRAHAAWQARMAQPALPDRPLGVIEAIGCRVVLMLFAAVLGTMVAIGPGRVVEPIAQGLWSYTVTFWNDGAIGIVKRASHKPVKKKRR